MRIKSIVLALASLLVLSACSSGNDLPSPTPSISPTQTVETAAPENTPQNQDTMLTVFETDVDGVKVSLTGTADANTCGVSFKNTSEKDLLIELSSVVINSWSVDASCSAELAPGKSKDTNLVLDVKSLTRNEIASIDDLKLRFSIHEGDDFLGFCTLHSGYGNVNDGPLVDMDIVWAHDSGGMKVSSPFLYTDPVTEEQTACVLFDNGSGKDIKASTYIVKSGDTDVPYYASLAIQDGSRGLMVLECSGEEHTLAEGVETLAMSISLVETGSNAQIQTIDLKT